MRLFKYYTINLNLLTCLKEKQHWFSALDQLNDPYEAYIETSDFSSFFNRVSKDINICCFTEDMGEILMWSHYADNHRGICVEWETQLNSNDYYKISYSNKLTKASKVTSKFNGTIKLKTNQGPFKTKYKIWKYEKEVRLIKLAGKNPLGQLSPYVGKLSAIYFGKRTSIDHINIVKDIVINNYSDVKFYKVDLNHSTMRNDKLEEI